MDGGGRLAGSLSETAPSQPAHGRSCEGGFAAPPCRKARERWRARGGARRVAAPLRALARPRGRAHLARCRAMPALRPPILIIAGSAFYGAVRGGQADKVVDFLKDVRDMAANAVGFNIAAVALTGAKHLSREEILATAGVTGRASLLFFDVADARARLLTNPWIAEATVQKLLPDRLVITISSAKPLRCGRRPAASASSRATARCSNPTCCGATPACRWWSGSAPKPAPRNSSPCWTAAPSCAPTCAPRCWSRSGAGTCG